MPRLRIQRLSSELRDDRSGGVAVVLGLALVPLVAVVGVSVDYGRLSADRADLQRAADAAAVAAARVGRSGAGDADAVAENTARANLAGIRGLSIDDVDHDEVRGVHVVRIEARRATAFGGLIGPREQTIGVRAEATFGVVGRPAEIAIVFDTTNSMAFGTRWSDAVSAIGETLDRLRGHDNASFFVSLVPFGDRVNIEDVPGARDWVGGLSPGQSWNGCVEPLVAARADDRDDDDGDEDGDDRDGDGEDFPYALDAAAPAEDERLFTATHRDNMPEMHVGLRENKNGMPTCPSASVVAPTTDVEDIEDALEKLRPAGTGRFDEGLAWGWRLVSPDWAGLWSQPAYPSAAGVRDKIVMFFTDGQSTAYDWEVGGPDGGSYGHNKGSRTGFAHLVDLCERMKTNGVRIVMVQLEGNDHFTPYAQDCASSPDDYHFVDGLTELEEALAGVGFRGGDIRIVR